MVFHRGIAEVLLSLRYIGRKIARVIYQQRAKPGSTVFHHGFRHTHKYDKSGIPKAASASQRKYRGLVRPAIHRTGYCVDTEGCSVEISYIAAPL